MSAYGTFSHFYCATPKGLATPVGAAHTPARQGCRKTSCTLTTELSPPTCGCYYAGCFASLDRFPARPLRLVLLPPRRWRGVKGDEVVHFTLDALNRPNTHRRGRWIGLPPAPAASQVRGGLGQSPKGLFFVFEVVRVDVTVQKRSKKCAFLESLLLKTPQIWPIDPTPTLTGGE